MPAMLSVPGPASISIADMPVPALNRIQTHAIAMNGDKCGDNRLAVAPQDGFEDGVVGGGQGPSQSNGMCLAELTV